MSDTHDELPHDLGAERALLGAVLNAPAENGHLLAECPPEAFFAPRHADVARALVALLDRGEGIDVKTLWRELRAMNRANTVGMDYLGELTGEAAFDVYAPGHARHIAGLARMRGLALVLRRSLGAVLAPGARPDATADAVLADVMRATERREESEPRPMLELVEDEIARIEKGNAGDGRPRYRAGLVELDRVLAPMQAGQLILIGGRPSAGKTSLVMHLARAIAREGGGVLVFSLETTANKLVQRHLASASTVPLRAIDEAKVTQPQFDELLAAANALSGLPVWTDDGYEMTLSKLRAKVRRHKARHGLGAIVIDYLQLLLPESGMGGGRAASREQEVAALSRGLKRLAKEFGVPVLALSQLNRDSVKGGAPRKPSLADLRDSGQLEQDADAVLLAYGLNDERTRVGVVIAKQKDGAVGEAVLGFDPTRTAFFDLSDRDLEAYARPEASNAPRGRGPAREASPPAEPGDWYDNHGDDFGGDHGA